MTNLVDTSQSAEVELLHLKTQCHKLELQLEVQRQTYVNLQEKHKKVNQKYQALYDFNSEIYLTLDRDNCIQYLNFKASAFLERERLRLIGHSFGKFVSSPYKKKWLYNIQQALIKNTKQICEVEIIQKGGTRKLVQAELQLVNENSIHLTLEDITQQRQYDVSHSEKNKVFELVNGLFQQTEDAVSALNCGLVFELYNKSFTQLFSKIFATKVEVGLNLNNVLHNFPDLSDNIHKLIANALSGKEIKFILENQLVSHENYYCYELAFYRISSVKESINMLVFHIKNLTQYKMIEYKQLEQQNAVTQAGICRTKIELASALAHEINQPLTAIKAYTHGCIYKLNQLSLKDEVLKEVVAPLEHIATQATLAGEVLHRMKNFVNEGAPTLQETDINQLIQETIPFLNYNLLDFKIKIDLNFTKTIPLILLDKVQIMQVILNLVRNSIEALQLSITLNPCIMIETEVNDEYVLVHCRDNGPGIAEEFKNKILNTYFTSKSYGTGLGLIICRSLIEAHGGELCFIDIPDQGAWFQIKLPKKRRI